MSKQTKPDTQFVNKPVVAGIINLVIVIVFIAGTCWLLWWLGNWVWDVIVAFFDWLFSGGSGGSADPYQKMNNCYNKHPDDYAAYQRCVRN